MATTVARLEAILSANTRDFDRDIKRSEGRMHGIRKAAGVAGLALAGGLAVGLKKSVDEAIEAEKVQKRLEVAFKNSGLSIGPYRKAIEKADEATRKLGFSDEEGKKSLGSLLIATKSFKKAREDLNVAMDIARFKNVDLETATKTLTMAMGGSQRAVKQLGLSVQAVTTEQDKARLAFNKAKDAIETHYDAMGKLTDGQEKQKQAALDNAKAQYEGAKASAQVADKQVTAEKVISLVTQKVKGQADAYSQTAEGQMAQFQAQTQELEETLGKLLLPALVKITGALAKLAEGLNKNKVAAAILVGGLVVLTGTLIAISSPVIAVTAAFVAMTTTLAILVQRYKAVEVAVRIVAAFLTIGLSEAILASIQHWKGLSNAVESFIGWTKKVPWGAIQKAAAELRGEIHTLSEALNAVVGAFKWILDKAKAIVGFFGKIGGAVAGAAGDGLGQLSQGIGQVRQGTAGPGAAAGAGAGSRFHVGKQLWDEIGMGAKLGLMVTSGYRPGAVTTHGTKSDHSYYPSRAVDLSGSSNAMAAMFNWLVGRKEIAQAFYDPMGSIFNGVRSSYREGGHSDHIHVAEYDRGGYLRPGWNLAYNGLGRPEPVGGGDVIIPVSIGGENVATVVFDMLRRKAKVFENRNGRPAFGGA